MRRAVLLIPAIAWAAMSLVFFTAMTSNEGARDRYLMSDIISAYSLALDLAADPTAVFEWHLPPANYIFPEQLFLAPFAAVGWRMTEVIPYYGALCLLLLTAGGYALARLYLTPFAAACAASVLVCTAGNLMINGYSPGHLIAAPNFHVSVFILWPAIFAAAAQALSRRLAGRSAWPVTLFLCVLVGLLSFSDRLTALNTTYPLLCGLALVALIRPESRRACLAIGLLLIICSSGGILLDFLWRPDNPGASVRPSLGEFFTNTAEMWRQASSLREGVPWLFYAALATPFVAAGQLAVELVRSRGDGSRHEGWLLLLAAVTVYYPTIHFVHAASTLEPVIHYRLLDLVIACIFLPILLLRWLSPLGHGFIAPAAASTLCFWAAIDAAQNGTQRNFGAARIQPLVDCLDGLALKYGLAYGAGEYWDAVPVQPLSRHGLVAVSVKPDLTPRPWNQTARIAAARSFDFVILNQAIDPAAVQSLSPAPVIEKCGDREILIPVRKMLPSKP